MDGGMSGFALPPLRTDEDRLNAAIAAMQQSPGVAHTVSSLARQVGMSRSHFAEAFRQQFARSPVEFLRALRMDVAAKLLRDNVVPIKLIGSRVGYNSRVTFSHAFRRCFGMSPAEFRDAEVANNSPNDIHSISERLRQHRGPGQDLTWEVDLTSGKVWWSEGTFAALGFDGDAKLISDVARFYERVHPDDRERLVREVQSTCMSNRMTWESQFRFRGADSGFVSIANGCIVVRDRTGAARRLLGTMRISEMAATSSVE